MSAGRILIRLLALAFSLTMVASACAQVIESGYVLLNNDRCLMGRIELVGDRYLVQKTAGNQVVIPRDQVQFVGNSRQELYRFKLNRLPLHPRPGDHFQLAQWCNSVQLLAEAGQHYLKVTQTHPPATSPAVKRLGIEIKEAMLQQPEFRSHLGMAPLTRTATASTQSSSNLSHSPSVQPASSLSNALLSNKVQNRFSEQIQHVLTNRCGAASCHGQAASNPLRLLDVASMHAARDTDANLRSVLPYINHVAGDSVHPPLLDYAIRPHGGSSVPAIDPREAVLIEALVGWIQFVQNPVTTAEATSSLQSPKLQPVPDGAQPLRAVPSQVQQHPFAANQSSTFATATDWQSPVDFPVGTDRPTAQEIDALDELVSRQSGVRAAGNPDDPFDPAEFHRLRSQRKAATNLQPRGEPQDAQ